MKLNFKFKLKITKYNFKYYILLKLHQDSKKEINGDKNS